MANSIDDAIARVLRAMPEVAAAWLFGSEARGQAGPTSDVDIALLLRDRKQRACDVLDALGRLASELEQVAPGRLIDLVLIEHEGPVFQHRALDEGRLVYDAEPRRRVDFESDSYVRYFDFLPTHELAKRETLAGLQRRFDQLR